MVLYDFERMFKRLIPLYLILIGVQFVFGRALRLYGVLAAVGLLVTVFVNLRMFYVDYVGKKAKLINMLPVGGGRKIFSKLLWGVVFSVIFLGIFTFVSFMGGVYFLNLLSLSTGILFFLDGYLGVSLAKMSKKWYFLVLALVLIWAVTGLIGTAVYMVFGCFAAVLANFIMCAAVFIWCANVVGK